MNKDIRNKIRELSNKKQLEGKRIFLFGCNTYTERINNFLYEEEYMLSGIIDNDKGKQGKKICNVVVCAPECVEWGEDCVVLVASGHWAAMTRQIRQLSDKVKIFVLADIAKGIEKWEMKEQFWMEENYDIEVKKLCQGEEVYKRLKQEEPLFVFPFPSIGDAFLVGVYIKEFESARSQDMKFVTGSKGAYKIMQMFGVKKVARVSQQELEALYKYVSYNGITDDNVIVCNWMFIFEVMARYKKIVFSKFCAKYIFRLEDNCQMNFPSIWDKNLKNSELINKGLIRGRSIILSPYATSMEELPSQFWEVLARKLSKMNYCVFTNIAGRQRPVKQTIGLEIPLEQAGNYLEFAGYFIGLRSGLCDIVGQSQCKKIVIFRDREIDSHSSLIMYYSLNSEHISEDVIQILYDDNCFFENIDRVVDSLA